MELREAPRPHWFTEDLLDMLGYYAPAPTRMQLQEGESFSSSNFPVKIEVLRSIGYFSPFLRKRMHLPTRMEVQDLCNRLRKIEYDLRSEQVVQYAKVPIVKSVIHELGDILQLALIQRPLLRLAARSSNEQLLAAMEQARC